MSSSNLPTSDQLRSLRAVINESLRVQEQTDSIRYINVGHALDDAASKQNHAIFARRGCGKTLLLHDSKRALSEDVAAVYLNCEDFKRHSFPNVLIEILRGIFLELQNHLVGWFGRKRRSKELLENIIEKLDKMKREQDEVSEAVTTRDALSSAEEYQISSRLSAGSNSAGAKASAKNAATSEVARSFDVYRRKLEELDNWLPELKRMLKEFVEKSTNKKAILVQVDDLYHLRRTDQAFVVDYIHRLCKDTPLYFKIATLRHASNLYVDRDGQPIGAQERHDYQSINIDYTFGDFARTQSQNWDILKAFATKAGVSESQLGSLFKGAGFERLIMAGGGVPRDVLSLFLEIVGQLDFEAGQRIGKDEMRILSRENFERRISELKEDSHDEEQGQLIRGIYAIRSFCLDEKTNVFTVPERAMQESEQFKALLNRLMDYRIIHSCATALTHKSKSGTYQAFAIDIGCYAHLRKHQGRFNEIDVGDRDARERMRSTPILDVQTLVEMLGTVSNDVEEVEALLLEEEEEPDDS